MSRSGYSDDGDYLNLWRANVDRTIRSARGQSFLRELVQSLEAMPEKKLTKDSLVSNGEVCAIGAVGLKRGIDMAKLNPEAPDEVGRTFGISSMLAQEIVYMNDEYGISYRETPEERWKRMHDWAQSNLRETT